MNQPNLLIFVVLLSIFSPFDIVDSQASNEPDVLIRLIESIDEELRVLRTQRDLIWHQYHSISGGPPQTLQEESRFWQSNALPFTVIQSAVFKISGQRIDDVLVLRTGKDQQNLGKKASTKPHYAVVTTDSKQRLTFFNFNTGVPFSERRLRCRIIKALSVKYLEDLLIVTSTSKQNLGIISISPDRLGSTDFNMASPKTMNIPDVTLHDLQPFPSQPRCLKITTSLASLDQSSVLHTAYDYFESLDISSGERKAISYIPSNMRPKIQHIIPTPHIQSDSVLYYNAEGFGIVTTSRFATLSPFCEVPGLIKEIIVAPTGHMCIHTKSNQLLFYSSRLLTAVCQVRGSLSLGPERTDKPFFVKQFLGIQRTAVHRNDAKLMLFNMEDILSKKPIKPFYIHLPFSASRITCFSVDQSLNIVTVLSDDRKSAVAFQFLSKETPKKSSKGFGLPIFATSMVIVVAYRIFRAVKSKSQAVDQANTERDLRNYSGLFSSADERLSCGLRDELAEQNYEESSCIKAWPKRAYSQRYPRDSWPEVLHDIQEKKNTSSSQTQS